MWKLISAGDKVFIIQNVSDTKENVGEYYARKWGEFRTTGQNSKSPSNSQRGFTQRKGVKSKRAGFTFLDEAIGCQKEIEKMNIWS